MEIRDAPAVPQAQPASDQSCPKCRTVMEPFDGADVKDRNYRGFLCPMCHWFKGSRSLGYGMKRVGARHDGHYDEPFEGKIRPQRR